MISYGKISSKIIGMGAIIVDYEGLFHSFDGTKLFYKKDLTCDVKGIVIIVHGIAEHLGRYEYVKDKLLENGYGVYRFDNRGHGKSCGKRGYVGSFNDFIKDLDSFVDMIKAEHKKLPLYILGHSMGGLITAQYGIEHKDKINGEIISGAPTGYIYFKTKMQSVKFPYFFKGQVPNTFNDFISRDAKVIEAYKNDEFVLKVTSVKLNLELASSCSKIKKNLNKYECPCLILHGKDDKIVPLKNAINFYERISSKDKKLKVYEGVYHEILNEYCKDIILKYICKWIDKQINKNYDKSSII